MARPFEHTINIELLFVNFGQIYKLQELINGSKVSNERLKKGDDGQSILSNIKI